MEQGCPWPPSLAWHQGEARLEAISAVTCVTKVCSGLLAGNNDLSEGTQHTLHIWWLCCSVLGPPTYLEGLTTLQFGILWFPILCSAGPRQTQNKMRTEPNNEQQKNIFNQGQRKYYLFVIISLQDTDSVTNSLKLSFVTIMPPVLSAKWSRNLW